VGIYSGLAITLSYHWNLFDITTTCSICFSCFVMQEEEVGIYSGLAYYLIISLELSNFREPVSPNVLRE